MQGRSWSQQLRSLSGREWIYLFKITAILIAYEALQPFLSLPRLIRLFDATPRSRRKNELPFRRVVQLVTGLLRHTYIKDYCMPRSIILFHFLRRRGQTPVLRFGVEKKGLDLSGHAWVELNGYPLAETGDPRHAFAITYSYPAVVPMAAANQE